MDGQLECDAVAVDVEGQEHIPIEVAILGAFFILSVQVRVPSQGQELNTDWRNGQEHSPISD